LVGCTPSEVPPKEEVPAVTESPVPVWTDEELEVIGAVEAFLEIWTEISQDPKGSDLTRIHEVAMDPVASDTQLQWSAWIEGGWHLEGAPSFTADLITPGGLDDAGQRYYVYGCYNIEHAHLIDVNGQEADGRGIERGTSRYEVIRDVFGKYLVLSDDDEGVEPC
jgi:hypothetical protein